MLRLAPVFALMFLAVGCADSDGDGLSDGKEKRIGSDADNADTDGDGVRDGQEVDLGLDPNDPDTDGDGYSDGMEVDFGSDARDNDDYIYEGGWPWQKDKDDIDDPGFAGRASIGDTVPNLIVSDQYGDEVELYDFALHGKPILLDISAEWCPPCRAMGKWTATGDGASAGIPEAYNVLLDAIADEEIYWVTVIAEDIQRRPADEATAARWHDDFPNEHIPVLIDDNHALTTHMGLQYYPSVYFLDDDMELVASRADNMGVALAAAMTYLQENE